jgi:cytochrome b6-f complex iron-sulfur subunit
MLEYGLGACGLAYVGAISYPIYRYLAAPTHHAGELEAGAVHELQLTAADLPEVGTGLVFRFGKRPALLIRHGETDYVCLDAVCTHMGCTVKYQPEKERIHCACHGGTFDPRTGANVRGPPPRPLPRYEVEVRSDGVVISRS